MKTEICMKKDRTDVSVIIPAYNSGTFIGRCVDSILAQTLLPKEIIVVDDGSSDNTSEAVGRYGAEVRYIRQSNAGTAAARNAGIKAASSKWIALLDHDDWWLPTKLEAQVDCAERFPNASIIYCDAMIYTPSGTISGTFLGGKQSFQGQIFEQLLEWCFVLPSTAMIRTEAVVDVGYFDDSLRGTDDYDMWIRLAQKGYEFRAVEKALVAYERQETSFSKNDAAMARSEIQLLTALLRSGLSESHRKKVRRKLALNFFNLAYEMRKTNARESVAAALGATRIQPFRLRNWMLLLKNVGWMTASLT